MSAPGTRVTCLRCGSKGHLAKTCLTSSEAPRAPRDPVAEIAAAVRAITLGAELQRWQRRPSS